MGKSKNNQLMFETFNLAVKKHPDARSLFHSNRGHQYTSKTFRIELDKHGMKQGISRIGGCIDNEPMEGFQGILKSKMYYLSLFETYEDLAEAIEKFIHYCGNIR